MNISGIGSYAGFYDYNSIRTDAASRIQSIPVVELKQQSQPEIPVISDESADTSTNQSFRSEDFARQYQPNASYELKGTESDIESLDMSRAISDMQKDQALQQYQFFIGESQAQSGVTAAPTVTRAVENFAI